MYIRQYTNWEWLGPRWFNLSAPMWILFWRSKPRAWSLRLFGVFNRQCADGNHYWGFSILQIGHRHLLAVGFSGVSILFIGRIP